MTANHAISMGTAFRFFSERIEDEVKSLRERGMTRYELCWDKLHSRLMEQSKLAIDHVWAEFALNLMEAIEDEILGPMEE